jgi:hypothetical protein
LAKDPFNQSWLKESITSVQLKQDLEDKRFDLKERSTQHHHYFPSKLDHGSSFLSSALEAVAKNDAEKVLAGLRNLADLVWTASDCEIGKA